MVVYKPNGRLGNSYFQMATAVGYAIKHNLEFTAPTFTNSEQYSPISHFSHLVNPNYDPKLPKVVVKEKMHCYHELEFQEDWISKNIELFGFFQSPKYFDFCKDKILQLLGFKLQYLRGECSIHVRRTDYLKYLTKHPPVTTEYLGLAIEIMRDRGYEDFLVFSDDMAWCRENINSGKFNGRFQYLEGRSTCDDLMLMSNCSSHIISNSSYSWWAAYGGQNPNRTVIAPSHKNWFGKDNAHLDTKDLLPDDWIQIEYTPIYDL